MIEKHRLIPGQKATKEVLGVDGVGDDASDIYLLHVAFLECVLCLVPLTRLATARAKVDC